MERVKVCGLPFKACGWNTKLVAVRDGGSSLAYVSGPLKLFGLVPLRSFFLRKSLLDGKWRAYRECDLGSPIVQRDVLCNCTFVEKLGNDQETPVGKWCYGPHTYFEVKEYKK